MLFVRLCGGLPLRRLASAGSSVQLKAGQGAEVLVLQKQHRALAQTLLLGSIQAIENRQVLPDGRPLLGSHGVAGKEALAAPGT